jgi:hypothetical protein
MTSLEVIPMAGLLAGTLDLTATATLLKVQGIPFERLFQTIASGALGPSAFKAGKRSAATGLLFHFLIALIASAIYYAASRKLPYLLEHPLLCGTLYGIAVHLVMSRIVLPLSAAPKRQFSSKAFFTQLVIHILYVGLPISLTISHLTE